MYSGLPQGMEDLARQIGARARAARQRLGLTQADVAEEVDIAAEVYGRLERGQMLPSVPTLIKLVRVLRITPNELLLGQVQPGRPREPVRPEVERLTRTLARADKRLVRRIGIVVEAMIGGTQGATRKRPRRRRR